MRNPTNGIIRVFVQPIISHSSIVIRQSLTGHHTVSHLKSFFIFIFELGYDAKHGLKHIFLFQNVFGRWDPTRPRPLTRLLVAGAIVRFLNRKSPPFSP